MQNRDLGIGVTQRERDVELLGQRLGNITLGHKAELHQQVTDSAVALLLQAERPCELVRIHLAVVDEDLAEPLF